MSTIDYLISRMFHQNFSKDDVQILEQILDLPLLQTLIDIGLLSTKNRTFVYSLFDCNEFVQMFLICLQDENIIEAVKSEGIENETIDTIKFKTEKTTNLRTLILNKYVKEIMHNLKGYNIKFNLVQLFRKIHVHIGKRKLKSYFAYFMNKNKNDLRIFDITEQNKIIEQIRSLLRFVEKKQSINIYNVFHKKKTHGKFYEIKNDETNKWLKEFIKAHVTADQENTYHLLKHNNYIKNLKELYDKYKGMLTKANELSEQNAIIQLLKNEALNLLVVMNIKTAEIEISYYRKTTSKWELNEDKNRLSRINLKMSLQYYLPKEENKEEQFKSIFSVRNTVPTDLSYQWDEIKNRIDPAKKLFKKIWIRDKRGQQLAYTKLSEYFESIKRDYEIQRDKCKEKLLQYRNQVDIFYTKKLLQQIELKIKALENVNQTDIFDSEMYVLNLYKTHIKKKRILENS